MEREGPRFRGPSLSRGDFEGARVAGRRTLISPASPGLVAGARRLAGRQRARLVSSPPTCQRRTPRSRNLARAESRAEGQQVDPGASRQRARRRMVPDMVRRPVRALRWVSAIVFIVLTVVLWGWAAAVASAAGLHRLQARPGPQERSPSRSSARATALLRGRGRRPVTP